MQDLRFMCFCKKEGNWESHMVMIQEDGGVIHLNRKGCFPRLKPDTHPIYRSIGMNDLRQLPIYEGHIVQASLILGGIVKFIVIWEQDNLRYALVDEKGCIRGMSNDLSLELIGHIETTPALMPEKVVEIVRKYYTEKNIIGTF